MFCGWGVSGCVFEFKNKGSSMHGKVRRVSESLFWRVCVCPWVPVSDLFAITFMGSSRVLFCVQGVRGQTGSFCVPPRKTITDFCIGSLCQTDTKCIFPGDCHACTDFFCWVSDLLGTCLLLAVGASWDITSIGHPCRLGSFFWWVFGSVEIFPLLSVQVN